MTSPEPKPNEGTHAPLVGREIGDYFVLRQLGRGAMAEVYLAQQRSLRRHVALKVLRSDLAADATYLSRFHNEALAAASLIHANIVQIYEVGHREGVHFIAQEYVPGQNLRQIINRLGPLDTAVAVSVMRQVAAALHKAGQEGIVHRDIKPENILLAKSGEVKVADFGLARVMRDDAELNLTRVGITLGTPLYMSPEQAEGRALDPRSDIYSFGVTAYHMLAGRPPFEGDTALAVAVQHLRSEPPPLDQARPDLPPQLCRIIHRMLAKSPDERFPSAGELLQQLRQLEVAAVTRWPEMQTDWSDAELSAMTDAHAEATARLESLLRTSRRTARQAAATRRIALAGLLAALLAFLAGGGIAWWSHRPNPLDSPENTEPALVERRDSAEAQFIYAALLNTEAAWRSVWTYYPPQEGEQNRYYARRAQQQLVRLLMQQADYDRAIELSQTLCELDPTEKEFRAFGLASQAVAYSLKGDTARAKALLAEALPLRDQLDAELRARLEAMADQGGGGGW